MVSERVARPPLPLAAGLLLTFLMLVGSARNARAEILFHAPQAFATLEEPVALATGDFDEDGAIDVATVGASGGLAVHFGDGEGDLAAPLLIATAPGIVAVRAGDLDADGHLDLAVLSNATHEVAVFAGTGSRRFVPTGAYPVHGAGSRVLRVLDFDEDGRPDLLVLNEETKNLSFLRASSGGGFESPVLFAAGHNPFTLETADIDEDGHIDLVVAGRWSWKITIFYADGQGGVRETGIRSIAVNADAAAVGDIDQDGHADIVVSFAYTNPVLHLHRGAGGGVFHPVQEIPLREWGSSARLEDFDGDGNLDIGLISVPASHVSILRGNGQGQFAGAIDIRVGNGPADLTSADLDADGLPEVIVTDRGSGEITVGFGDGRALVSKHDLQTTTTEALAADFNEDGNLDVATVVFHRPEITLMLGDGRGGFSATRTIAAGLNASAIGSGDFDEDGHLDLVVPSILGEVHVLLGNGNGGFGLPIVIRVPTVSDVGVVDFDSDGHQDIIVAHVSNPWDVSYTMLVGDGNGGFVARPGAVRGIYYVTAVDSGDFDRDGFADLALAEYDAAVTIAYSDGQGGIRAQARIPLGTGLCRDVRSGDLDGDGFLDLVVTRGYDQRSASVLFGGVAGFSSPLDLDLQRNPLGIELGDFDADGWTDIVVTNELSYSVSFLRGTGPDRAFKAPVHFRAGKSPWQPVVGDFDGDRFPDLVVTSYRSWFVSILRNLGPRNAYLCKKGAVNRGAGRTTDVLQVNGSPGDVTRTVTVREGDAIDVTIDRAPGGGSGRFVVHANAGFPTRDSVTPAGADIGRLCFPIRIDLGATPIAVWNSIGRRGKLGRSHGFDGAPIPDPAPAPTTLLSLANGDPVHLPAGTEVTFNGILVDPGSRSGLQASVTNAVVLTIQ